MMANFDKVFGKKKPAIAMVHLAALPGSPLYDAEGGIEAIIEGCTGGSDCVASRWF